MTRKRNLLAGDAPAPPAGDMGIAPSGPAGRASDGGVGGQGDQGGGGSNGADGCVRAWADPDRDFACMHFEHSDLGNAERWLVRHGRNFRFCAEIGWFAWDGRRWHLLSEEKDRPPARVMQSVFATVRAMRWEAKLMAATGAIEPDFIAGGDKGAMAWAALRAGKQDKAIAAYLRGVAPDDRERVKAWLIGLEAQDMLLDLGKAKMASDRITAHARTSESGGKMEQIARVAKNFSQIAVGPDDFDRDRMAINVRNGTLRLVRAREKRPAEDVAAGKSEWRTGGWKIKLTPHAREDLMTKVCRVDYKPGATCPDYDQFIERMQPDVAMRRFIHQWGGLSLTGDTSNQKLAFFYGSGRNGKGTWVETVAHIAGDYAGSIPIESFLQTGTGKRGDQATPDIARLPGVRFLRVSEPAQGSTLNEGLIKQVTGEDPVDARHLNKGFFTFLPSFKMTISGNNKPKVKDTTDGIWRRMQLVPWAVVLPKDQIDLKLKDRMRDNEGSGILNRLLEGLCDWRENGLIEPDAVRNATQAYRDKSDELGRFLSQCCEVGGDGKEVRVRVSDLYALYQAWAKASEGEGWQNRGFNNAMFDKGFERKTSNGEWWLKVRPLPGATVDAIQLGHWPPPDDAEEPEIDDGDKAWSPDGF
jgi:P4 family phage/plasmid primase-like protien